MNQTEAYQYMVSGKKVRHQHYSDHEYVFINDDGIIETEEGFTHGTVTDIFWANYQRNLGDGWMLYEDWIK